MSNHEAGRLFGSVLGMIPDETDRKQAATLLRLIFREGSVARLDHGFSKLVNEDPLTRLSWLMRQGMLAEDVRALIREAEARREQDRAFTGTYGLTESDIRAMLAEGFHTAFRKAVDHPYATVIHKLIKDLPPEDWTAVLDFMVDPVISALRAAEQRELKEGKEASCGSQNLRV